VGGGISSPHQYSYTVTRSITDLADPSTPSSLPSLSTVNLLVSEREYHNTKSHSLDCFYCDVTQTVYG